MVIKTGGGIVSSNRDNLEVLQVVTTSAAGQGSWPDLLQDPTSHEISQATSAIDCVLFVLSLTFSSVVSDRPPSSRSPNRACSRLKLHYFVHTPRAPKSPTFLPSFFQTTFFSGFAKKVLMQFISIAWPTTSIGVEQDS
jgi:hypothetical protein